MPFPAYERPFDPDQVQLLRRVFLRAAMEQSAPLDTLGEDHLAARLIDLFRSGVHEEASLLQRVRENRARLLQAGLDPNRG